MKNKSKHGLFLLFLILIGLMTSPSVLVEAKSIALNSEENFTIVVLPDTQFYSNNYPRIFDNQTQWIIENKESMNIVFVTHLGDLMDHPLSIKEWNNANTSMSKLDGNVPYGVLPGNHDGAGSGGDLANYNNYFGFNRFNNESWYGGAYQNINTNNYQLFSAGGDDYLIFHIQFNPTDDILSWASNVIDQYPHRKIIVSTHDYVDGWNFFADSRSTIGDIIWKKLVEPHADQIFLVLSGHYENEARLTSSVDGNFVHQLLSDYQARLNGGNGWLRIIEFSPKNDEISIKTYSPYLNEYETDSNSQFILDEIITENNFMFPVYMFLPMIILSVVIMLIVSYFIFRRSHKIKQSGSI